MKHIKFHIIGVLLTFFSIANAQSLSPVQQQKIDEILARYESALAPGLAIGVVKNGSTVYEQSAGLAELSYKMPFTINTRTNIASNAKQFVAIMALDLANRGKLNLDQDIRAFFPSLYQAVVSPIKISYLINHSSGIRDIYDLMGLQGNSWWREEGFSNKDAMTIIAQQQDLNFTPGSEYLYSNSNYILLTEIIAKLTGEAFSDYSSAFFTRLGMPNTAFVSDYMKPIEQQARPYANWGSWKEYPSIVDVHGDGNLYTTLKDQLVWESLLQTKSTKILSEKTLQDSQGLIANTDITNYGYGLEFGKYKGLPIAFHDGETGAFRANFLRFPSLDLAIVVISNNGQVYAQGLALDIANILIDASQFSPAEPNKIKTKVTADISLDDAIGFYERKDGRVVKIFKEEDSLFWQVGQNRAFGLKWDEGNLYSFKENPETKVLFDLSASNLHLIQSTGATSIYSKYPNIIDDAVEFAKYTGVYVNDEVNLSLKIEYMGAKQFKLQRFQQERNASESEATIVMIKPNTLSWNGFDIDFVFDGDRKVNSILLQGNRIKNVVFKRSE